MTPWKRTKLIWRERANLVAALRQSRPSFSQYGEDIVFEKLLHPGQRGTYVDVGANHPINGSNTFRLYLRGWSGLAIDPNPQFADDFKKSRPRDNYLTEGAALEPTTLTYYAFENDVLNTLDGDLARGRAADGEKLIGQSQVLCRPLAEIVDQYLSGRQIDLLNVDCEGLDLDVIKSLDLSQRRPTVILVEDYPRFITFQRAMPPMRLETFLREHGYLPLAQTAWSGFYIAEDWRKLFSLSNTFAEDRVQNGYLPGQASLSDNDK